MPTLKIDDSLVELAKIKNIEGLSGAAGLHVRVGDEGLSSDRVLELVKLAIELGVDSVGRSDFDPVFLVSVPEPDSDFDQFKIVHYFYFTGLLSEVRRTIERVPDRAVDEADEIDDDSDEPSDEIELTEEERARERAVLARNDFIVGLREKLSLSDAETVERIRRYDAEHPL